ncbi:ankyrin repeat-containing domain protein, partial [Mycena epipterygia]
KIEKWLGPPPDMGKKQHDTLELLKEGTGRWLLDGNELMEWQDNPGALWIRGDSGSGKSVLSSAVIKKLIDERKIFEDVGNSPAVAFFYFDFNNKEGHIVESALRRIILQLSSYSLNGYRALEEQYTVSNGQTPPSYQELLDILQGLLLELGRTYIILDGLDECEDTEIGKLVALISMLRSWTQSPLHLLITSQPRSIFTENFSGITCVFLASEVTEEDISSFVDDELRSDRYKLKTWASRSHGPNITDVTQHIVQKSKGMFRLAACLLFEISRCKWQDKLDETLRNLPGDLFGIYGRFLERIRKEDMVYIAGVLRWMLFSKTRQRNQLEFIADAIAFDFSNPERHIYHPSRREDNGVAIVEWLEGLVTISNNRVVLAHASVQDYLLSAQFMQLTGFNLSEEHSHTFLAQSCIGYLLHFADHPLDPDTIQEYPWAEYAAKHWCHHLLRSHDQSILFTNAMHLLDHGSQQYIALNYLRPRRMLGNPGLGDLSASPLHICSQEGYIDGVRNLLKNGAEVNIQDQRGGNPLQAASFGGHTDIAQLLLANGADVNSKYSDDMRGREITNPLLAACWNLRTQTVQLLLENGAVANARSTRYGTALHLAALKGGTEIVRLLLEHGANINAHEKCSGSVLQAASTSGHTEIVRLLLENGANVNGEEEKNGSPLYVAAREGHREIVGLLLGNGADVNVHGQYHNSRHQKRHGSALKTACVNGQTEIACLLLEHGADVNEPEDEEGLLRVAASMGQTEIVSLLLERGANVNAQSKIYGSALRAALHGGHTKIVRLLLEQGADVNEHGEKDDPLLVEASTFGHTEIVRLLLETGGDANVYGKYRDSNWLERRGSALQAASDRGHAEIVHLLLEHGADVNVQEAAESPLSGAAKRGHTAIVRLLLAKGADPNAHGKSSVSGYSEGRSGALKVACLRGSMEVVRLLLENGADVNGHEEGGSPLEVAASSGHTEIVDLLLETGANVNPQSTRYGSPLEVAVRRGHTEIVGLLLGKCADVNAQSTMHSSPLWYACRNGHADIVRLLLANVDIATHGSRVLEAAASEGHTDIVGLLLEKGVDVNAQHEEYGNALQAACRNGHINTVRLLLANADIATHGARALEMAARSGGTEVVGLLLEKGVNANGEGEKYHNALAAACTSDFRTETVRLLLENGSEVNGHEEESPLQVAATNGCTQIVRLLLGRKGVNVNAQSKKYGSALQVAAINGHLEIVSLLLKKGADVNSQSKKYGTALHTTCRNGHADIVRLLLENGVDIETQGGKALQVADKKGHKDVVRLLLEKGAVRATTALDWKTEEESEDTEEELEDTEE